MQELSMIALSILFTVVCGLAVAGCGGEPTDDEIGGQTPATEVTSQEAGRGVKGAGYMKCLHDCRAAGTLQQLCDKKCGTFTTASCTKRPDRDAEINMKLCLAGITAWKAACDASLIGKIAGLCDVVKKQNECGDGTICVPN